MDHLGIASCPVIGHMAGAVYAFAAAARLGSRITHIVNVAGGVPIVSTTQFALMTPRQRVVAHTARFAPRLLPLILRAGIALLDSGGDRAFMKALYASAPVDFNVANHPEVFAILRDGYRFTVAQGHRAFEIDAHQVVQDWTELAESSNQQVLLLHGRCDPVVGTQTVRDFATRLGGRAELVEHATQGQLLFYADPGFVLDAIERVL
jgi:pimeloyl-ACP methyl ester carboxylesterase